jgi:hypothetical protein
MEWGIGWEKFRDICDGKCRTVHAEISVDLQIAIDHEGSAIINLIYTSSRTSSGRGEESLVVVVRRCQHQQQQQQHHLQHQPMRTTTTTTMQRVLVATIG